MIQTDWITSLTPGHNMNATTVTSRYGITGQINSIAGVSASTITTSASASNWADTITISGTNTNIKNALDVRGDASFQGEISIKGVNLADTLSKIEQRLAIIRPNEALEGKWEKLKDLGRQYREMEKDILEKEKIWKILER
jgi:hypothetical protein